MSEATGVPSLVVHEIEEMDLRSVFQREDRAFTPWLSRPENLSRLARALSLELEFVANEVSSTTFRTDIVARSVTDGAIVVIENQFGRSDHDHFGKAMTYLAAHGAKTVVWIAETFADEHRAALAWLNDNTPEEVGFYAVAPRLMRIAGSPPGLRFDVVVAPNKFVKKAKQEERKLDESVGPLRAAFWTVFDEQLDADEGLADCERRYGGRLGFRWLLPVVSAEWAIDEPHVLVWVNTPSKGRQGTGVGLHCRENARSEAEARLRSAVEALAARGLHLGGSPADLSSDISIRQAASELLSKIKIASEELKRAFHAPSSPEA